MRSLKNKTRNQGGFTLIEMLIVVAIIAILVAVSIPLVNSALERARRATDAANERAAKAEATILYLTENIPGHVGEAITAPVTGLVYDAATGSIQPSGSTPKYGKCKDHKDKYLTVSITATGEITVAWNDSDVVDNGRIDSTD